MVKELPERDEERLASHLEKMHQRLIDQPDAAWDLGGKIASGNGSDSHGPPEDLSAGSTDLPLGEAECLLKLIHLVRDTSVSAKESTAVPSQVDTSGGLHGLDDFVTDVETVLPTRIGRFEIGETLGHGGFGVVVRGYDPVLGRPVAIKIPKFASLLTTESRERILREAKAAASLSHPRIVTLFESGQLGPVCYLASELVDGPTLAAWLDARKRPVSADAAAQVVRNIADAIQHAHDRGVIHRDIKPGNILLQDADTTLPETHLADHAKIGDFGLAKRLTDDQDLTGAGAMVGTPSYMAPEQTGARDQAVGIAADIWAMGGLLYELVTGTQPFRREHLVETITAIQKHDPAPARSVNDQVPEDLDAIIQHCLEKDPARRYASAYELQLDLKRFLERLPVSVRPIRSWERGMRWAGRHRGLAAALSVAGLAIVTTMIVSVVGWWFTASALQRERMALHAESLANQKTGQALEIARQRYLESKQTVNTFYNLVCENPQFQRLPQSDGLRTELLEQAMRYLERFAAENQDDPDLQLELARTYLQMGSIQSELGAYSLALPNYLESERLLDGSAQTSDQWEELRGRNTLQIAQVHLQSSKSDEAIKWAQMAVQQLHAVMERQPTNLDVVRKHLGAMKTVGDAYWAKGDVEKALESYQSALMEADVNLESFPKDPELQLQRSALLGQMIFPLRDLGRSEQLEQVNREVRDQLSQLISEHPSMWDAVHDYVAACDQAARMAAGRNDFPTMQQLLQDALPHVEKLQWVSPESPKAWNAEAAIREKLGYCLSQMRRPEEAETEFGRALEATKKSLTLERDSLPVREQLATLLLNLGTVKANHNEAPEQFEELFRQSLQHWQVLHKAEPEKANYQLGVAASTSNLAATLLKKIRPEQKVVIANQVVELANQAIDECRKVLERQAANPQAAYLMFMSHLSLSDAQGTLEQFAESVATLNEARPYAPPPLRLQLDSRLAFRLAKLQRWEDADNVLERTKASDKSDANDLWRLALANALLLNHDSHRQEEHVQAAVAFLDACRKRSIFWDQRKMEKLEKDDDWQMLRETDAFRNWKDEATTEADPTEETRSDESSSL